MGWEGDVYVDVNLQHMRNALSRLGFGVVGAVGGDVSVHVNCPASKPKN